MANKILGVEVDRGDVGTYNLASDLSTPSAVNRADESGSLFTDVGAELSKAAIEGGVKIGGAAIGGLAGKEVNQLEAQYQADFESREEAKRQLASLPKDVASSMVSRNDMSLTDTPVFTEEMQNLLKPFNKEVIRLKSQINSGMRGIDFNSKVDATARKWIVRFPWAKEFIKDSVSDVTGSFAGGGGGSGGGKAWQDKQDVEEEQKIQAKKYDKMSEDLTAIGYPKGYFYENPSQGELTWYVERDALQANATLIAQGQAAVQQGHIVSLATAQVNLRKALTAEQEEIRKNKQSVVDNAASTQSQQLLNQLMSPAGIFAYENPLFDINVPGLHGPKQKIPSLAEMVYPPIGGEPDPRLKYLQETAGAMFTNTLTEEEAIQWDLFLQEAELKIPGIVAATFTARKEDGTINEQAVSITGEANDKILKHTKDIITAYRERLWATTKLTQENLKRGDERDNFEMNKLRRRVETSELLVKELKDKQYLNYSPELQNLMNVLGHLGPAGGQFLAMNQSKAFKLLAPISKQLGLQNAATGDYVDPETRAKTGQATGNKATAQDYYSADMSMYKNIFGQMGHEENAPFTDTPEFQNVLATTGTSFVQFLNKVKSGSFVVGNKVWTDGYIQLLDMTGTPSVQSGIDKAVENNVFRKEEVFEGIVKALEVSVGFLASEAGKNVTGVGPFSWHGQDIKIDLKSGLWVDPYGMSLPPTEQERLSRIFPYNKMVSSIEWLIQDKIDPAQAEQIDFIMNKIPGNLIYGGAKVYSSTDKDIRRAKLDAISQRSNVSPQQVRESKKKVTDKETVGEVIGEKPQASTSMKMPTVEEETLETPLIDINLDDFIPGVGIFGSIIEMGVKTLAKKSVDAASKGAWKHIFDIKKASGDFETQLLSRPNFQGKVGFDSTTGKSIYGNYWKEYKGHDWKVVMMSPDDYIKSAITLDVKNSGGKRTEESIRRMVEYTRLKEGWEYYSAMLKKGQKVPIPSLHVSSTGSFSQEGYHRAFMAREMGMKEIPVLITAEKADKFGVKYVRDIIQK